MGCDGHCFHDCLEHGGYHCCRCGEHAPGVPSGSLISDVCTPCRGLNAKRTEFRALISDSPDGALVLDAHGKWEWTLADLLPDGARGLCHVTVTVMAERVETEER
jgi:hypothetical protein